MFFTKERVLYGFTHYGALILGSAILAFGLFNVHSQSQITEGGVLGMTLLLKHWFGISPGISGLCMDALCYIIGFRLLGKAFLKMQLLQAAVFRFAIIFLNHLDMFCRI